MAFVSSFLGASVLRAAPTATKCVSAHRVSMAISDPAAAVPFWPRPKKLTGELPGDVGFDPALFSEFFDLNFLRESEVKHGRVCMLAIVGWFFPEVVYRLPGEMHMAVNPLDAPGMVGWAPMLQIFLFTGLVEAIFWEKCYDGKSGGNYNIDPLGLASGAGKERMQLAEIKNGRLAMIAIGGAIHHALITGQGMFEQIYAGNWFLKEYHVVTPF